ncbi:DUF58 domain-containing protein [Halorhabdus sp. BNX81]|uniref:DUF58 domain-containing protein n=1 Tax=Halorhabdus sp. BNX81 TaxID=2980181 RepID=UPI0023DD1F1F|nr:DUF58 domain-containing protein [Halorhabdus sp. BNX81]WEL22067.1 putative membrane anchored protein with extracellular vWF domain and Ig-like domain [Halorhabdus sp. BNX81]
MRLTNRGWVTVGVAVAAFLMAWLFGARSLNAVAVPAVVAVVAAAAQLKLADRPAVSRSNPHAGFPEETRAVTVEVTGTRGTIIHANDTLSRGLSATDNGFSGSVPVTHTYEMALTERGRHAIGPLSVHLRDVFGLVSHEIEIGEATDVIVYPQIHDVTGSSALAAELERNRRPERQEIDQLREYVPGDPLRDIDWKSSAKRLPDLVVTEFIGRETMGTIEITISTDRETADRAASAAGSVALFFSHAGLEVGLTAPDGNLKPSRGETHRSELLQLLAETGPGTLNDRVRTDADIRVVGDDGAVTVDVNGQVTTYEDIRSTAARDRTPVDRQRAGTSGVTVT